MTAISELSDEQFKEWAGKMIAEAIERGIPVKGTGKISTKRVGEGNLGALVKMRRRIAELNRNDIDIARDIDLTYAERANFSTLRQYGLVAKVLSAKGRPIAARWLLTPLGAKFLRGQATVPKRIKVMNNHRVKRLEGPERVDIKQAMGQQPAFDDVWDYRMLQDTSMVPDSQASLL